LTATPFVRTVYRPFQRVLHRVRQLLNPDVPLDHQVLRVSFGDRQIGVEVRRWNNGDRLAADQCFRQAQYDMPKGSHGALAARVYREIVASGKKPLIVDCGANIGASVLWFHARYPEAHIVAVEPAPDNFALLERNCRGLSADLRQAAIGAADGDAWLSDPDGGAMGYRTNQRRHGIEIEMLSLETLLASKPAAEYTPYLLKVDIEGAEKSLFTLPTPVLDQFPIIILEPHDWMFPGQQTSLEFFRFHAQAGREFCMNHENVASIASRPSFSGVTANGAGD
jgi:FkbM family methyltransferase